MVMNAFGISITTFVGQNFGAQKYDRVKKSVRICLSMALGATITLSAVLFSLWDRCCGSSPMTPPWWSWGQTS